MIVAADPRRGADRAGGGRHRLSARRGDRGVRGRWRTPAAPALDAAPRRSRCSSRCTAPSRGWRRISAASSRQHYAGAVPDRLRRQRRRRRRARRRRARCARRIRTPISRRRRRRAPRQQRQGVEPGQHDGRGAARRAGRQRFATSPSGPTISRASSPRWRCPGVGAVTCLYHGRGDAGGWSRLAAQGISYGFLPGGRRRPAPRPGRAVHGLDDRAARARRSTRSAASRRSPTCSPTITRSAWRCARRGCTSRSPPITVAHGCAEPEPGRASSRHETALERDHPPARPVGLSRPRAGQPAAAGAAGRVHAPRGVAADRRRAARPRSRVAGVVDRRRAAARPAPWWWLPARDLLTFGLFHRQLFRAIGRLARTRLRSRARRPHHRRRSER